MSTFRTWAAKGPRRISMQQISIPIRHYAVKVESEDAPRKRRRHNLMVSTVNPSLITPADYVDISQKQRVGMGFPVSGSPQGSGLSYATSGITTGTVQKSLRLPFPAQSRGFLYYHSGPHVTSVEGGLRFRVTSDDPPSTSSFHRGQDLLAPSGCPWQMSLLKIASSGSYGWIAEQLVRENLVTQEQLLRCARIFSQCEPPSPQYTVFRLDSTFLVNFARGIRLTVVGEALHAIHLTHVFAEEGDREGGTSRNRYAPWRGSAEARFEPSTLPEYAGRRVVHMRIMRIIQPVGCAADVPVSGSSRRRMLQPEEGELYTVQDRGSPPKSWAYDIDNDRRKSNTAFAFQVLWENSSTP
ncbi:hypothetical protein DFH09DRAFT_1171800 [Mycena vulgaris]|nr:hypothetical protein DFH09DRAFT_1171800 [Mycena vulgaris]